MALQAIVGNIEFGFGEPAGKGMFPDFDLIPGFKPEKMGCYPPPECIRIRDKLLIITRIIVNQC